MNDKTCVTDGKEIYIVDAHKNNCNCAKFQSLKICPHVVAILDNCGKIEKFLQQYCLNTNASLNAKRPIQNGDNPNKKKRRGRNNVHSEVLETVVGESVGHDVLGSLHSTDLSRDPGTRFTEIYHNNLPFTVVKSSDVPKDKVCESCKIGFNPSTPSPYNMVFCKKERYRYPIKNNAGMIIEWKDTVNKLAIRYYCVKRACVLKRHPYFWGGMIEMKLEPLDLKQKVLLKEFGYEH